MSSDIEQVLSEVTRGSPGDSKQYERHLEILEAYECWDHWFRLVDQHAKSHPDLYVDDQIRLARVYIRYFDDIDSAARCCVSMVESSGMPFGRFREEVLAKAIEQDDFATEGFLLQKVIDKFHTIDDRVSAAERLCYIYEKKIHNEHLLNSLYEKLLAMQPSNVKALRYFRTLNTQLQDWPAVIDTLKQLLAGARHPQEGFRYAQEMAAVQLFQLDNPEAAIAIIEEHCANSTLDTSTIHYEAYYRLGRYEGCLRVLRACLLNVEEDHTRAVVHFRIASLYEQLGNLEMAIENYKKSTQIYPQFIEAFEGLVMSGIKQKKWSLVRESLRELMGCVKSDNLAAQIGAGIQRLDEGLASNGIS